MNRARRLTIAESRRPDGRGRHVALHARPDGLVMACPLGHEYLWVAPRPVNYAFLASWWSQAKGGVTAARNSCPECPVPKGERAR